MARLIYSANMSLDDYVADQDGRFDWAAPDEEVQAFVNDLQRPVGTYPGQDRNRVAAGGLKPHASGWAGARCNAS